MNIGVEPLHLSALLHSLKVFCAAANCCTCRQRDVAHRYVAKQLVLPARVMHTTIANLPGPGSSHRHRDQSSSSVASSVHITELFLRNLLASSSDMGMKTCLWLSTLSAVCALQEERARHSARETGAVRTTAEPPGRWRPGLIEKGTPGLCAVIDVTIGAKTGVSVPAISSSRSMETMLPEGLCQDAATVTGPLTAFKPEGLPRKRSAI
jgi:hypothetical protein